MMGATIIAGRRLLTAVATLLLALALVALHPAPASAETDVTEINLPGVLIENQCNGEPVGLSGRLLIVVSTRPTADGGTSVRSVNVTRGLQGTGLLSGVPYRAVEVTGTRADYVPAPGTGTVSSTVLTLLLPQDRPAPTMLLVVRYRGTLEADGTVLDPVVDTQLICRPRGADLSEAQRVLTR